MKIMEDKNRQFWDAMAARNAELYRRAYARFMYRWDNEYRCENCPEAGWMEVSNGQLPCGQYRCWVTAHCKSAEQTLGEE